MTVGDFPERLEGEARNPDHYSDNRPLTAARLLREAAARIRSLEGENARLISDIDRARASLNTEAAARIDAEASLAKAVEGLERARDSYAAQARFADPEPAAWFREFVRRIDQVLSTTRRAG